MFDNDLEQIRVNYPNKHQYEMQYNDINKVQPWNKNQNQFFFIPSSQPPHKTTSQKPNRIQKASFAKFVKNVKRKPITSHQTLRPTQITLNNSKMFSTFFFYQESKKQDGKKLKSRAQFHDGSEERIRIKIDKMQKGINFNFQSRPLRLKSNTLHSKLGRNSESELTKEPFLINNRVIKELDSFKQMVKKTLQNDRACFSFDNLLRDGDISTKNDNTIKQKRRFAKSTFIGTRRFGSLSKKNNQSKVIVNGLSIMI